jgi:hypothetical protein
MPRFLRSNALPLTVALQGLSFGLLGFFFAAPPSSDDASRVASGDLARVDSRVLTDLQIPRDLERRRLPVPRLPDPEEPNRERTPKPRPDAPDAPMEEGSRLASLRVESVTLAALVSVDAPAAIPDAPDSLSPHELSGGRVRSWLGGRGQNPRGAGPYAGPSDVGDGGDGGWGGSGIGGSGGGSGGYCPTPGGFIGGGGGRGRPGSGGGTVGRPAGPTGGSGGGQPAGGDGGRGPGRAGGGEGKGRGKSR